MPVGTASALPTASPYAQFVLICVIQDAQLRSSTWKLTHAELLVINLGFIWAIVEDKEEWFACHSSHSCCTSLISCSFLGVMPIGVYSLWPFSHISINLAHFSSPFKYSPKAQTPLLLLWRVAFPSFEVFMPANPQTFRTPAPSFGLRKVFSK